MGPLSRTTVFAIVVTTIAFQALARQSVADTPTGLANPDFEHSLDGWEKDGTAFNWQPTYSENVKGKRVNPVSVGGDYWADLIFPIGVRGDYWIGTFESRPTAAIPAGSIQGDEPTGTLTSAAFKLPGDANFLSFLIGGGQNVASLKIELLEVNGKNRTSVPGIDAKTGSNSEILRRDWWSIASLDKTKDFAIRITDNATTEWGHISIDDIRFDKTDPSTAKLPDGRPMLLRATIGGQSVWTDYDAKLWGAADLHTHLMSHLSMGGKLMHGAPDIGSLAPRGTINQGNGCNATDLRISSVEEALSSCNATHGGWGTDNTCGDTIRAAAINIAYDTKNIHRIKFPHEASCDPSMEMNAGLCYPKCSAGFHGLVAMCHKDCPANFRDDSFHCGKPASYGRGTGYAVGVDIYWKWSYGRGNGYSWDPFSWLSNGRDRCLWDHPSGCDEGSPSIWYPSCSPGYKSIGLLCWQKCRAGYSDDGLTCRKDGLQMARDKCNAENAQGCEQYGLMYYPRCYAGFHAVGCCVCSPDCPAGMTDIGVSCQKNGDYNRGIGKPPLSNAHGDHQHAGYPTMAYWPHSSTKSHQQMYVDWIRRAHEGGLNVIVALAVNNELLAEVVNGELPKDDQASADQQLDEIRAMIKRHTDFMREVQSAAELRQAIKEGKLAVIVGVEIDNIGNFNVGNPALLGNEATVKAEIQRLYYDKGVRYAFPLHFADNVFGGVAVKGGIFNLSNRFARTRPLPIGLPFPPGMLYQVQTATDPFITYRLSLLGKDGEWAAGLTLTTAEVLLGAIGATPYPPAFDFINCPLPVLGCVPQFRLLSSLLSPDAQWDQYQFVTGGQVNVRGLSPIGEVAVKEMMRLGMFIDIDHMSEKAADRTLEIALKYGYPVNSGHTSFRLHQPPRREDEKETEAEKVNENMRTPAQLRSLGQLGGLMGIGWAGGDASSFLDNYHWAIEHGTDCPACTKAAGPWFSLGSDINGFEEMPKPRECTVMGIPGLVLCPGVAYCKDGDAKCLANTPGALYQYAFGTTASGAPRLWDYNKEGVAHIGLYPDIFQDLKNAGMSESDRQQFFGAADALARMWDKMELRKAAIP